MPNRPKTDCLPDYNLDPPEDCDVAEDDEATICYYCGDDARDGDHRRCRLIGELREAAGLDPNGDDWPE